MFEPINDRVLCRDKSYIPEKTIAQTDAEKIYEAEVIAVPSFPLKDSVSGEFRFCGNTFSLFAEGEIIRFNPMGVEPITIDGEKLILIRIPDIYGIVRK